MPTYISHVSFTEQGIKDLKDAPNRIDANKKLWEESGGKLVAWYIVMGDYDALLISEAPNEKVMAEIAIKSSRRGRTRFKTYAAIPIEEFSEVSERL